MKKKQIYVVLSIFVLSLAGFFAYYITGTPDYSLYRLRSAIEQKDLEAAEYYVDVDAVADAAVDDIMEFTNEQMESELKDSPFSALTQGFMLLLEPRIRTLAKQNLRDALKKGTSLNGQKTDWRHLSLLSIKRKGKVAEVRFRAEGMEEELGLTLRQSGDRHWRVVAISTFAKLLRQGALQK